MLRWTRPLLLLLRCPHFRAAPSIHMIRAISRRPVTRQYAVGGMMLLGGIWGWLGSLSNFDRGLTLVEGVAKVLPSTVQIRVEMSTQCIQGQLFNWIGGKRIASQTATLSSNGTGFVIRDDGLILTNAHNVADMLEGGHIRLIYHDGASTWADLLAVDLQSDLALLSPQVTYPLFEKQKYPPVEMSSVEGLREGEPVATIGNPLGLCHSVSTGAISALNRSSEDARQCDSRIKYVQTDLHVAPGSSGGPLLTRRGRVIGMVTSRAEMEGIAFAIQLDSVHGMLSELESHRKIFRPWLGFKGIALSPSLVLQVTDPQRQQLLSDIRHGVLVTKVHAPSHASWAQLQPGDIITHADGKPIDWLGDILIKLSPDHQSTLLRVARLATEPRTGQMTVCHFEALLGTGEFDIIMGNLH